MLDYNSYCIVCDLITKQKFTKKIKHHYHKAIWVTDVYVHNSLFEVIFFKDKIIFNTVNNRATFNILFNNIKDIIVNNFEVQASRETLYEIIYTFTSEEDQLEYIMEWFS